MSRTITSVDIYSVLLRIEQNNTNLQAFLVHLKAGTFSSVIVTKIRIHYPTHVPENSYPQGYGTKSNIFKNSQCYPRKWSLVFTLSIYKFNQIKQKGLCLRRLFSLDVSHYHLSDHSRIPEVKGKCPVSKGAL